MVPISSQPMTVFNKHSPSSTHVWPSTKWVDFSQKNSAVDRTSRKGSMAASCTMAQPSPFCQATPAPRDRSVLCIIRFVRFVRGESLPAHIAPAFFLTEQVYVSADRGPYDKRMEEERFQDRGECQPKDVPGAVVLIEGEHFREDGQDGEQDAE